MSTVIYPILRSFRTAPYYVIIIEYACTYSRVLAKVQNHGALQYEKWAGLNLHSSTCYIGTSTVLLQQLLHWGEPAQAPH